MAQLRSISRPLRRFAQVGSRRRALAAEAAAWLLFARLALIFVPFPQIARRIGRFVSPTDAQAGQARQPASPAQAALASDVGWAVTRVARYLPFKAICLPQAMAARIMLKRRGIGSVLHFGAAKGAMKDGASIDAHAWLDAAGVEVTGYPVSDNFTEIACFV